MRSDPPVPSSEGVHLVLYDGVCGLCNRVVLFLLRHDRRRVFRFASLQGDVGRSLVERSGGTPGELSTIWLIADYGTGAARVFTKSDAALFVADELGWPWRAARVLRFAPKRLRDLAYDVVARTRYRVFGRYERCPLPKPEFRGRFIDAGP